MVEYRSNEDLASARASLYATRPGPRGFARSGCRSIWLSDFHLGTHGCKAAALLDFLKHHEAENLYLVGDIVDGWKAGPSWYWSSAQKRVVEEIAAWRRRGSRVEVIPGNHDDLSLLEALFGFTPTRDELIHRTAEGRRMLVIHGHQFDGPLASARMWKSNQTYSIALKINQWYSGESGARDHRRGSLSTYLKYRFKRTVEYFSDFDDRSVIEAARRKRADGVICGHIHRAEQRLIGPIWYVNDGDWVHSRTALTEDYQGGLRLLRWDPIGDRAHERAITDRAEVS